MLDATNTDVHTDYVLVKSVGPKFLWMVAEETTGEGGWRIFTSPPIPCLNCGDGDRWCPHLSSQALATFIPFLRKDTTTTTKYKF
ncbi:hypothetical protein TNCV_271211 [Trichonephila clavipes]|nr:hypothetical protein TNCV_271211 [Trichonephila clavipes]